ncbi:MAG: hypothetical protein KDJ65_06100 [Anaerolineae bacterium]|nr:hypothetical protein [Anaerolineae bacterium]
MFYIGIENHISPKSILDFFHTLLPHLHSEIYEDAYCYEEPTPDIAINYYESPSEFKVVIEVSLLHKQIDEDTLCSIYTELSRLLANQFRCKTLCEGTHYGDNPTYPGYSLIWNNNKAFLADDYGCDFFDEGGGPVKILREISVDSKTQHGVLQQVLT